MASLPPVAHDHDPITSFEAESHITESGRRESQAQRILRVVTDRPGLTAGDIGDVTGYGHVPAQRRLSDLLAQGKIVRGAPRVYKGSNRRQSTWWLPARQARMF